MSRISSKSKAFLQSHEILQSAKRYLIQTQIILLLHHSICSWFLQHVYTCMKKFHTLDKFYGIDNNSARKYGEFPIQIHSVNSHILFTKYVTAHKIHYTKESWPLQYTSHISKFWFVILLKFSKISILKVISNRGVCKTRHCALQVMFVSVIFNVYFGHRYSDTCQILPWFFSELFCQTARFHIFLWEHASKWDLIPLCSQVSGTQ